MPRNNVFKKSKPKVLHPTWNLRKGIGLALANERQYLNGQKPAQTDCVVPLGLMRYIESHFISLDDLDGAWIGTVQAAEDFRDILANGERFEAARRKILRNKIG